jgi:hypothetical protein
MTLCKPKKSTHFAAALAALATDRWLPGRRRAADRAQAGRAGLGRAIDGDPDALACGTYEFGLVHPAG